MGNEQVCDELMRLLRVQRHDFINHIQVIHTMLQMGKIDRTLTYIENLAKDPALITDPLRSHTPGADCRRKA